ncbi:MAG: A/G-specific adenine glycosylase [Opitutae bacterium]|nr:A/G-specific adenine glycosylase [Opitutae bacterium]
MASSPKLISRRPSFQAALHAWYRVNQRQLPWRDTPSLYKTVVSEFMLQQTQVATVLPYFDRWLRALPDFATLAAAPEAKVMKLWEGLGYYSRARNLHKLAQTYVAASIKPRTSAEWRELPGVGPYTAAAITSIAFGEPAAVVDGNVVRILARLTGEGRLFRDGTEAVKHFTPLAGALVVGSEPGEHNQAMMELGATVCLRQNPQCQICPVARFCAGRKSGSPEKLPRLKPKTTRPMFVSRTFCLYRGALLLRRGHARAKRLAGLHELPEAADLGIKIASLRGAHQGDAAIQMDRDECASLGGHARPATAGRAREDKTGLTLLAVKRRSITRFRITESIYAVKPTAALLRRIANTAALEWVPLRQLDRVTLSGPHKRWIAELFE